jgi:long-chain acyl-CoA synthetase
MQTSEVVLRSGGRTLTRATLQHRAALAASALHGAGLREGDAIALLLRNDLAFFEATMGAALLGAACVPLNWHLTADEVGYVLEDSGAKWLVAHSDLVTPAISDRCTAVPIARVETPPEIRTAYQVRDDAVAQAVTQIDWDHWLAEQRPWTEAPRPVPAPIFYTSGTTGRPKGVRRTPAEPPVALAIERRTRLAWGLDTDGVRAIMTGPLYHSATNAYALYIVRGGGQLVLQPRFDAEGMLELIERHRITHAHLVPTMFQRLLTLPAEVRAQHELSSLRCVVHGAAPCPPETKRRMIDWWGPVIREYYAMTEIGIATAIDSSDWLKHPGSVGRALPGVDLRIVDEQGQDSESGCTGEICVRSETTVRFSYNGAAEKLAAMRLGDHVRTGDVGRLDADGYLYITDRKTDLIISGGVNVYPAEIESVLAALPGVSDCAVFGVPDEEFGERPVAVVVTSASHDPAPLIDGLGARLARYKLPREILFVGSIPREDSGKVRKRQLRQQYLAGRLLGTVP